MCAAVVANSDRSNRALPRVRRPRCDWPGRQSLHATGVPHRGHRTAGGCRARSLAGHRPVPEHGTGRHALVARRGGDALGRAGRRPGRDNVSTEHDGSHARTADPERGYQTARSGPSGEEIGNGEIAGGDREMKVLITGSSGLIGSELVQLLRRARAAASSASTTTCAPTSSAPRATRAGTCERLQPTCAELHATTSSTSATAPASLRLFARRRAVRLIVHCAAQPSHDLAAAPAVRRLRRQRGRHAQPARGDAPARARRRCSSSCAPTRSTATRPTSCRSWSCATRWDYARPEDYDGIDETMRIDRSHALALRRQQGGRRRDGAGVRPLLRHEDRRASAAAA